MVPNYPHHIVQRGHNRKVVFLDEDYQFYPENLKEWTVTLGIKIYAWCLMTNHIHLIVEPYGKVGLKRVQYNRIIIYSLVVGMSK